jgi:hypothetical protein
LLPETLDDDTKRRYQVITYSTIRDVLYELPLRPDDPHQFLVLQYRKFLDRTLAPYSVINDYCTGAIGPDLFFVQLERAVDGLNFGDNDIRTFVYFYYYGLEQFIKASAPDLAFGTCDTYAEAERENVNMCWAFEKNMQGPPFMETIIRRPFDMPEWSLHSTFRAIHEKETVLLAPRLEIWLDLPRLATGRNTAEPVGSLMLGTWSSEFKAAVKQLEPYRNILKPRGSRNFHCEPLYVRDLPFSQMAQRIRDMMRLIFDTNAVPSPMRLDIVRASASSVESPRNEPQPSGFRGSAVVSDQGQGALILGEN